MAAARTPALFECTTPSVILSLQAAAVSSSVVVLATELTPELVAEGLARDVVRLIQDRRKDIDCAYTDRIEVGLVTTSTELQTAIERFKDFVAQETLAKKITSKPLPQIEPITAKVLGHELTIYVSNLK